MLRTIMDTTEPTGIGHPQVTLRGGDMPDCEDDPKKMLAELDRMRRSSSMMAKYETDQIEDPKRMLAELEKRASPSSQATMDDPKRMLADLDQNTRSLGRDLAEDEDDDDLEILRSRLAIMLSPASDQSSHDLVRNHTHLSCPLDAAHSDGLDSNELEAPSDARDDNAIELDKKSIPYAVALQLESAGYNWEVVKGWTTYLFSSGLDGHVAQQQKDAAMKGATEELDSIIEHTMKEDLRYREAEEKERLLGRLIISNLAADADEDELRQFFCKYKFDICDVTFLEERDPVRRTRVAHVDMWTRKAAVEASFSFGYIFGLRLNIQLVIEQTT